LLNSSDRSPWILKGLLSSCFDISDDESGMAMDILFKPRVQAMEEMTQNTAKQDNAQSKNQRQPKTRLSDMYCM